MIFQHRDGELRIYSGTTVSVTADVTKTPIASKATAAMYMSMLFVNAGFSAPISRSKPIETLVMNRGVYDSNAEYRNGMDSEKMEPLPISWAIKTVDDTTTQYFIRMITGSSPLKVRNKVIRSTKGESKIDGVSTPQFSDTSKLTLDVQVLWDGTSDLGFKWREVYFPGAQQTISESEDEVVLNINGMVYGDVTRITAFLAGTTILGNSAGPS